MDFMEWIEQFFENSRLLTGAIVVRTEFETGVTVALVGAEGVEAGAVVANVGIALALVDVDAGITAGSQSVATAADALERALEVVTLAVVANAGPFATLVNICGKSKLKIQIKKVYFEFVQRFKYRRNLCR